MNSLKGTKTAENLLKSFSGESQARNRYTFYESAAKKEGFIQISNLFNETAGNEKEHAERFFKLLQEGLGSDVVEITATYPVALGDTKANLLSAANGEHEEWSILYPAFADVAEEEGFANVALTFRKIAEVEVRHETRYRKLLENLETDKVFTKDVSTLWKCINCGYIYEGVSAPKVCPTCLHPQSYFEVFVVNY